MRYDTIGWDFSIDTDLFTFRIAPVEQQGFSVRHRANEATLYCPVGKMSDSFDFQLWLRKAIREVLREQARRLFPPMLRMWSEKTGLHYHRLGIHMTSSKWGSYSSLGNLNLSVYLLLMDARFVDYTMCHELCHSVEMNHGAAFWSLLDSMLGCDARLLGKEMNGIVKQWYGQGDARCLLISGR